MRLPRFIKKMIPGYKIIDMKEWLSKKVIEFYIEQDDKTKPMICYRCGNQLEVGRGKHRLNIKHLSIFNFECYLPPNGHHFLALNSHPSSPVKNWSFSHSVTI